MTELLRPSPDKELETFEATLEEKVDAGLVTIPEANEIWRRFVLKQLEEMDLEFDYAVNGEGAM